MTIKRLPAVLSVVLLVLSFNACASVFPGLYPRAQGEQWIGRNHSDLMLKWGPPTRSSPDGQGGQILVYEFDQGTTVTPGYCGSRSYGRCIYWVPERIVRNVNTRTFWVHSDGTIYHFDWSGL